MPAGVFPHTGNHRSLSAFRYNPPDFDPLGTSSTVYHKKRELGLCKVEQVPIEWLTAGDLSSGSD